MQSPNAGKSKRQNKLRKCVFWPPVSGRALREILAVDQITYMVEKYQSFQAVTNQIGKQGYTYCWLICDGQNAGFCGSKIRKRRFVPQQALY